MRFPLKPVRFTVTGFALIICLSAATAANDPNAATNDAEETDALVLQAVFDDMLSKDNGESPAEWRSDQSKHVYVSKHAPDQRPDARDILSRNDEEKWKRLTKDQLDAATQATDDLIARADNGDSLPALRSTSGRLKIFEDAGAATQPTRENPFPERASVVYSPGYSKDGRFAVVRLAFPWSGRMHSGEVTYILERIDDGWRILLRDFVYYV